MDLFWSGKFWTGSPKKRKKKKTLRSQVRFLFLFLNLLKTMDLFWSGEFCSGNQKNQKKKENPAKPGAVPFLLIFELVENYGFVLVR